jgi:hypothetical protein
LLDPSGQAAGTRLKNCFGAALSRRFCRRMSGWSLEQQLLDVVQAQLKARKLFLSGFNNRVQ